MIWTLVLVTIGVTGTLLAPRTWWGWAINAASEFLWFAYGWTIHAPALMVMAVVWLAVHLRNVQVTRPAAA
jgi:hypothetical protein